MQLYINRAGQQLGPFTEAEVQAQMAAGTLSMHDLVWWQGAANWMPIAQSPYAGNAVISAPLPVPGQVVTGTAVAPTSQLAIWSLVCGVSSFACCLTFIPAIILGHMSLAEIKKKPHLGGRGLALAGVIIGYAFMAIAIVYLGIVTLIALGQQVKKQEQVQTPDDK